MDKKELTRLFEELLKKVDNTTGRINIEFYKARDGSFDLEYQIEGNIVKGD